jgi:hypothetical protein
MLFYSRRVGAAPSGPASGDFVDYPRTSTILGAAKLTGRLPSKTSIGLLGAVTSGEEARTFDVDSGTESRVGVAPRTTFAVARVMQEFGSRTTSTVAGMVTAVHRDFGGNATLAARLPANAFVGHGDLVWRFAGGEYETAVSAVGTYVEGTPAAIDRLQRSSARYFQRPDIDYLDYDPSRGSLDGGRIEAGITRASGRHWLWTTRVIAETPELENNDAGRLMTSDGLSTDGNIRFRETRPGRLFRNYTLRASHNHEWNFGHELQTGYVAGRVDLTWLNYWTTGISVQRNETLQNARLTRGGPSMLEPSSWTTTLDVGNSNTSPTQLDLNTSWNRARDGGSSSSVGLTLAFRPGTQWRFSLNPEYSTSVTTRQYVTELAGGPTATFGRRYVFSRIVRHTYSTQVRVAFALRPDLTLDFYAEPFAASGRYGDTGELVAARTRDLRLYGTDGSAISTLEDGRRLVVDGASTFTLQNPDFNVLSYRSNLVLRWEWRRGSSFFAVWQQNRSDNRTTSARVGVGDLLDSLSAPGDNVIALKMSLWLSAFGR